MRKPIFTILILLIFEVGISQEVAESDLIGEWTFIELQDENGEKQTKIPLTRFGRDMGIEKVNRDSYIFNDDGTYKSFNPLNTSYGTWFLDKKTNEINLELRIEPDSPYLPSLKKAKIVTKRKDGFYYQKAVKKRILIFGTDSMTIADREKYVLIYERK
ncbi:hypothetical protein [Dokdonia sinensis]|uniref:hypothetical protein n=1 Tax=Dokdonia sinensis TaxID=2479847 RepID=UPI0011C3CD0A|nr:hypothetical protein [Dokdonia sinensis]